MARRPSSKHSKNGILRTERGGRKQKRGERKASVGHLELAARPGPGGDDDLHDLAGRRLDLQGHEKKQEAGKGKGRGRARESRGSRGEEGEHEERCADA